MPFAAVGGTALASAAISGVASYFGQRSQAKALKKQQKQQFAIDKYFKDIDRQDALKKQLYKEQAIGAYRGMGTPGLTSPAYTDPNSITPVNPYAPKQTTPQLPATTQPPAQLPTQGYA